MQKLTREQLADALRPYGLDEGGVAYLGGGREDSDGVVYAFDRGGEPLAVKILSWKEDDARFRDTLARLEHRLDFAAYLLDEGAPVLGPMKDTDGLIYRARHDGQFGFVTYLMPRATGRNVPPDAWDAAFLRRWGAAIGQMHRLAARYPHGQCPQTGADGLPLLGWRNEVRGFLDWCRDDDIKAAWLAMGTRLDALPTGRECFGFIHNDPHVQNILDDGSRLSVIDFDVANYHWFVTDISIALQSVLFMVSGGMERPMQRSDEAKRFLAGLMDGYCGEYTLDNSWLERLDLFVNYRRMLLFTVMQDWLDTNGEAKVSWKRMIQEEPQYFAGLR